MYKSLHLKLFINRFGLKINSTFLLYSELYWVFLLLLEINTLILLKWQMCFWWSDVNLFTILHTQTHAHTHTLTHIRTIFAAISLSHSVTLSLCHSVVASLPGGFHVQLVLLEWSAAAPKAATETASARRQRWQRPAFITVCAFWVFLPLLFLVFFMFFCTLFNICLCPITVAIYSSGSKACKQKQQQQRQRSSHHKGGRPTKESSSSTCSSSSPPPFPSHHFSLLSECL